MNQSTRSASLKEIHVFLQSLIEDHFYFIYFSLEFLFYRFILFKKLLF